MRLNRRGARTALLASLLSAASAADVSAQADLAAACAARSSQSATAGYCAQVAQIADVVPARIALVAAGGNPVPGTASTLGIRLGSFPRFSVNGRLTMAWTGLPAAQRLQPADDADVSISGWHGDVSIGLYSGLSPFATVGGVGSIDLLGSLGTVRMPDDEGLNGESITTWGAGARIGITRESFTTPGISLSAMYRDLGEFAYGDNVLQGADAFVHMDETYLWSFRGLVGKRLTALGLTGGVGYDRYGGETLMRVRDGGGFVEVMDDHAAGRWNAFVNGSFTLLVLSAIAEVGWQSGGDPPPGARTDEAGSGAFFASVALRLGL
jgi:hypothetical protein